MRLQDRTHCVNGHPFTEANIEHHTVHGVLSDGTTVTYRGRRCRACHRIDRMVHYYTKQQSVQVMTQARLNALVRRVEERMEGVLW